MTTTTTKTSTTTKKYRQGDVLLIAVDSIPKGKKKNNVLARGEHTGHFHAATTPAVVTLVGDEQYIFSEEDFSIAHQEHEDLSIPAGKYKVRIQRELDLLGEVQKVRD